MRLDAAKTAVHRLSAVRLAVRPPAGHAEPYFRLAQDSCGSDPGLLLTGASGECRINRSQRRRRKPMSVVISRTKGCVVALTLTSAIALIQNPASAANYVAAAGINGTIIVNQSNGTITFCPTQANLSTTSVSVTGECVAIGSMSSISLEGNVQITVSASSVNLGVPSTNVSGNVALILNTATGIAVECPMFVNNGQPTGVCGSSQQIK